MKQFVKFSASKMLSIALAVALVMTVCFVPTLITSAAADSVWTGETVAPTQGGDGSSEDNAILITNAEELAYVIGESRGEGKYYKLTADIYLNELDKIDWTNGTVAEGYTAKSWYKGDMWAYFTGTLDGNGHVVYGLYYNDATAYSDNHGMGLVPHIGQNTTVKNIGVETAYLNGDYSSGLGVIVGSVHGVGSGTISQCYIGSDVTVVGVRTAGGILGGGAANGTIAVVTPTTVTSEPM